MSTEDCRSHATTGETLLTHRGARHVEDPALGIRGCHRIPGPDLHGCTGPRRGHRRGDRQLPLLEDTQPVHNTARPTAHAGQLDWSSDGCSYSPDNPFGFKFLPTCHRHDFGYRNYKRQGRFSEANRLRIDNNFKSDMYKQCGSNWTCRRTADLYYAAVREFGGSASSTATSIQQAGLK
ncbi:hypothetical protein GCM10022267_31750 [Lentzea roselyniae]|uniref:Phospholipase A2 n=1 Tax=Lentzea roselyniae TaxID=531940 RepID=A0ABP7AYQ8_9PSEU